MSVEVMTAVFKRYPNGGGEMLLALALADHAHDDGTKVFPFVKSLADKTRQSVRSVQYQLRKMEECGWLILVNAGNGGRGQPNEYRINPDWIKGAEIAPIKRVQSETEKGANDDTKGASDDTKGCNGLHPHITINEPSVTINKPSSVKTSSEKTGNRFQEFWETYPSTGRKVAKASCLKAWKAKKLDELADKILEHLRSVKTTPQWTAGYEPAPLTYLNQRRWEDGLPSEAGRPNTNGKALHSGFAKQNYHAGVGADGSF